MTYERERIYTLSKENTLAADMCKAINRLRIFITIVNKLLSFDAAVIANYISLYRFYSGTL
ncbi:hypothetical protein Q8G35_03425 [Peribacillus simplex]|uniref:Uncharacterized protein n=2 Tax=Peribacillus TaxID=2675229 RepID=A0AA90P8X9_9BACI|nr:MULTISPECIES: hypothetical protein [Peribacillus]MDP1417456.1 hypothetical protein [Peribacillus simplex]MDP1450111.1 hypothetical protein [Peribacillus frigoritolerans]